MYEFLLEKKLSDYKLHPKVAIVAAMNRSKESGVMKMEEPIKDRLALHHSEFHFDEWRDEFFHKFHPYVSSFLEANQKYALEQESMTLNANGSPRSWTMMSSEFQLHSDDFIAENSKQLSKQHVSEDASKALEQHIVYFHKLDFKSTVEKRKIPNFQENPLDPLDQVIWSHILHYIETPEDAVYLVDLLNTIVKDDSMKSLTGGISGNIYKKFLQSQEEGGAISEGQKIVVDLIMGNFDPSKYSGKVAKIKFNDKDTLLSYINQYIN